MRSCGSAQSAKHPLGRHWSPVLESLAARHAFCSVSRTAEKSGYARSPVRQELPRSCNSCPTASGMRVHSGSPLNRSRRATAARRRRARRSFASCVLRARPECWSPCARLNTPSVWSRSTFSRRMAPATLSAPTEPGSRGNGSTSIRSLRRDWSIRQRRANDGYRAASRAKRLGGPWEEGPMKRW